MITATPRIGIKVKLLDLMIMLYNVHNAAIQKNIGFEDADHTINTLAYALGGKLQVQLDDVESALWSCNLLDEQKKFWHPMDLSFDKFVEGIIGTKVQFNKKYNFVESKR